MHADDTAVLCYSCRHDVDEHDERARCLDAQCSCGWRIDELARIG
jgi:hypothetical protein